MNVITQEIKYHLKSTMIWTLSMGLFGFFIMLEFSAYYNNPELLEILDVLPESLMKAFGFNGANLTSLQGFLSVVYFYVQLIGALFAVMLGVTLLLKEHKHKTSEMIFSMPIKKGKVVLFKMMAGVVLIALFALAISGMLLISSYSYVIDATVINNVLINTGALFLFCSVWLSIGLLLVAMLPVKKHALAIGAVLVFAFYVFETMISLVDNMDMLSWVSLFGWFNPNDMVDNSFSWVFGVLALVLVSLFTFITVKQYQRKDIVS